MWVKWVYGGGVGWSHGVGVGVGVRVGVGTWGEAGAEGSRSL